LFRSLMVETTLWAFQNEHSCSDVHRASLVMSEAIHELSRLRI
jgi:hypothetical protein